MSSSDSFNAALHLRSMVRYLEAVSEYEADVYGHRGGRGEKREQVLRSWIGSVLPPGVSVAKGEVVDSAGRRSAEFDIVVSVRAPSVWPFGSSERLVHAAEEVISVIEVKTMLNQDALMQFSADMAYLSRMERFFVPVQDILAAAEDPANRKDMWVPALPCGASRLQSPETFKGAVGEVGGLLFAYRAPAPDTVSAYLESSELHPGVKAIYVLGVGLWQRQFPERRWRAPVNPSTSGPFSLKDLLGGLQVASDPMERWSGLRPDFLRYLDLVERQAIQLLAAEG